MMGRKAGLKVFIFKNVGFAWLILIPSKRNSLHICIVSVYPIRLTIITSALIELRKLHNALSYLFPKILYMYHVSHERLINR